MQDVLELLLVKLEPLLQTETASGASAADGLGRYLQALNEMLVQLTDMMLWAEEPLLPGGGVDRVRCMARCVGAADCATTFLRTVV